MLILIYLKTINLPNLLINKMLKQMKELIICKKKILKKKIKKKRIMIKKMIKKMRTKKKITLKIMIKVKIKIKSLKIKMKKSI
jgi:hypothetical protein